MIIVFFLIFSGNQIYLTKSYAAYIGPICNEKDVVGFSPITSKVAFLTNDGSATLDNFTLYTVNSDGTGDLVKIGTAIPMSSPVIISPDGKKILFSSDMNETNQLMINDIDGNGLKQLTKGMGSVSAIAFFPNSTRLIFGQNLQYKTGFSNIYSINDDGTHLFQITHDPQEKFWTAVSANGKTIVYNVETGGFDGDIYTISTDGIGLHRIIDGSLFTHKEPVTDNGTKIIFTRYNNGGIHYEFLYSINTDGTGFSVIGQNPYYSGDFITTHNGSRTYYWPVLRTNSSEIIFPKQVVDGLMQIFTSTDNGVHVTPLVNNSYFKPNPDCKLPCDLPSGCGDMDLHLGPGTPYPAKQVSATDNNWSNITGFGAVAGIAAIAISVYVMKVKKET
jgi:Tol biopolymer transport system component